MSGALSSSMQNDVAMRAVTAAQQGLLSCNACKMLSRPVTEGKHSDCPRCHARLHSRIPHSLTRTWAFLIAAFILYVPANLLPIMETKSFFGEQQDTIMSGVIFLWVSGSWVLAMLVFIASIVIPLFKLISLTYLVLSVQSKSHWQLHERTRLYRLIDAIGRWSMLDVYVVTLLVALVQINALAHIRAGLGATAFGAVVVLTILAANSFDPRLLWDFSHTDHDRH
jgi:paraquat-inducible protein A